MTESTATARVIALIETGRSGDAATEARTALAADPDNPELHRLLALALSNTGDIAGAIDAAQRAVALRPEGPASRLALGIAHYRAKHYEVAAQHFQESLSLSPTEQATHVWLAEALLKQVTSSLGTEIGRHSTLVDQADQHGAEAIKLQPDRAGGYLIRGKVQMIRKDAFHASHWAHQALALEPDNVVGHQLLGLIANANGDTRAAADHFVTAGKLNPRSDGSIKMLKGVRGARPLGAIGLLVVTWLIVRAGSMIGGAIGAIGAILLVALIVGFVWYWPRLDARRSMSPEARRALAMDRQIRRGRR